MGIAKIHQNAWGLRGGRLTVVIFRRDGKKSKFCVGMAKTCVGCPTQGFVAWGRPHASFFEWGLRGADLRGSVRQGCIYGIHSGIYGIAGSVNLVWTTALKNEITGTVLP